MATNLKDALRRFVDDQTITAEERKDLSRAGLIHVTGTYSVTELGRTMAIQNPSPMPGSDPDNPRYLVRPGKVELNQTFGKLGSVADQLYSPEVLAAAMVNHLAGPSPEFSGHLTGVSAKDVQVGGDHYKKLGHHQPWEVLATWMTPEELRGYMKGTVIAYLAREQEKGKDQDIEKALHTMQLWQDVRKDK